MRFFPEKVDPSLCTSRAIVRQCWEVARVRSGPQHDARRSDHQVALFDLLCGTESKAIDEAKQRIAYAKGQADRAELKGRGLTLEQRQRLESVSTAFDEGYRRMIDYGQLVQFL